MSQSKKNIIVGITGASGAIYAKKLLDSFVENTNQIEQVSIVLSKVAQQVWSHEITDTKIQDYPFKIYEHNNYYAPFASGSYKFDSLVVCPCTMGTLGRIASGTAEDLIARTADVALKERRRLILVARETPLNLIHLKNMTRITEAGGIILPASPSFYTKPENIDELVITVVNRILDLVDIEIDTKRWGKL